MVWRRGGWHAVVGRDRAARVQQQAEGCWQLGGDWAVERWAAQRWTPAVQCSTEQYIAVQRSTEQCSNNIKCIAVPTASLRCFRDGQSDTAVLPMIHRGSAHG